MEFKNFEKALNRLEEIVAALEKGDLPLEKALKIFEEGMSISRFCSKQLDEAERRVEVLLRDEEEGVLEEQPFEGEPRE